MSKFRLSHSTIEGLLTHCGYRVGLSKVVGLDEPGNPRLAVGTAFHHAVEQHERNRVDGVKTTQSRMLDYGRDQLIEELTLQDNYDTDTYNECYDMLSALVHNWYNEGLRDRVLAWKPVSIEVFWRMWLPDLTYFEVCGAADTVYLKPDGNFVVVDLKSANGFQKYPLDGSEGREQAAMYVLAAIHSPLIPVRGELVDFEYHVARTKRGKTKRFEAVRVVPIDITDEDLDYVKQRIGLAHQKVVTGEWVKNPDTFLCSKTWCPFHQDAGGPCDPQAPNEFDVDTYLYDVL